MNKHTGSDDAIGAVFSALVSANKNFAKQKSLLPATEEKGGEGRGA